MQLHGYKVHCNMCGFQDRLSGTLAFVTRARPMTLGEESSGLHTRHTRTSAARSANVNCVKWMRVPRSEQHILHATAVCAGHSSHCASNSPIPHPNCPPKATATVQRKFDVARGMKFRSEATRDVAVASGSQRQVIVHNNPAFAALTQLK